jgi:hypothetical protein
MLTSSIIGSFVPIVIFKNVNYNLHHVVDLIKKSYFVKVKTQFKNHLQSLEILKQKDIREIIPLLNHLVSFLYSLCSKFRRLNVQEIIMQNM